MKPSNALYIAMVGILTFSNSLINEFVWDDRAAVIGNPDVVDSSIWQLLEHDFWGQPINSSNSHKSYRPITVLSFKLNYMLFGLSPMAFHAMNVALHGWVCYLVCECGQSILGSKKGSIIAGLLFAVHPIHCDAVSSIVGRADVLCTMFSLMSFLCYQKAISITARNKRLIFIGLSMMLLLAGALSKELGISMIGIFLVVEWQRRFVYKEANERRCGMLLIFVACFMKWRLQLHGESMLYQWTELENYVALLPNVLERILTTAHCHAIYLWKLIWPKKLSYDYGFNAIPKIDSLLDSRCISTLVAYALVAGGLFQIRQNSTLILIAAFCLLPFVPAANVLFPVGAVVAERVLYFPSVGFCLGMAYLLEKYVRISVKGLKVVGFCITAILSLKCILRNTEWKTEQSLFESGIRDYPSSVKMLSNRATQLLNPKDANIAKTLLESAIFIYPQYESAHLNLGLAFDFSKNSLHAIQEYHIVLEINQARFIAQGYLGVELFTQFPKLNTSMSPICRFSYLSSAASKLDIALTRLNLPLFLFRRGNIAFEMAKYDIAQSYFNRAIAQNNYIETSFIDKVHMISYCQAYNELSRTFTLRNLPSNATNQLISLFFCKIYSSSF